MIHFLSPTTNEHSPCGGAKIFIVGMLAKGDLLTLFCCCCCCEEVGVRSEDDMDGFTAHCRCGLEVGWTL